MPSENLNLYVKVQHCPIILYFTKSSMALWKVDLKHFVIWDGSLGRGSNPRPHSYQECALPTELPRLVELIIIAQATGHLILKDGIV